jgi:hypothetical protein
VRKYFDIYKKALEGDYKIPKGKLTRLRESISIMISLGVISFVTFLGMLAFVIKNAEMY